MSPVLGEDPQPGQGAHGVDSQAFLTGSPPLPRPASLLLTPPPRPQSPALTLLLEDEACWLRTLPRALTEAEANSEIYRKGWYPGVSLTAFRRVGGHGSPWAGS